MAELSLQALWEMLRGAPPATPPPMSLSALDQDPWSRYNQPFGEIRGTAPEDTPVAFQTRNGVRITEGDIQRGMDVGMGAATVGGPAKGVLRSGLVRGANDTMKPLTEKQFYDQYSQHVDIRSRAAGNAADVQRQIMEEGFRRGGNVNTLPAYRGGEPRNIVDRKMAPKAGDTVYLVPNSATREMGNGRVINEGWKPAPHEVLQVEQDYPSLYQAYLRALGQGL